MCHVYIGVLHILWHTMHTNTIWECNPGPILGCTFWSRPPGWVGKLHGSCEPPSSPSHPHSWTTWRVLTWSLSLLMNHLLCPISILTLDLLSLLMSSVIFWVRSLPLSCLLGLGLLPKLDLPTSFLDLFQSSICVPFLGHLGSTSMPTGFQYSTLLVTCLPDWLVPHKEG